MRRSHRALLGSATLTLAGVGLLPAAALAHTPSASDSCEGLNVTMSSYPGPGTPNYLTVTIDGAVALNTAFGESFSDFLPWSQTASHQWTIVVDGLTDDGDATLTGTHDACQTTTTADTGDTSTTVDTTPQATKPPTPTTSNDAVGVTPFSSPASPTTTSPGVAPASSDTTTSVAAASSDTTTDVASLAPAASIGVPPSGVSASGSVASATGGGNGEKLPATGSHDAAGMALLAAGLVGAGSLLAIAASRRWKSS